MAKKSRPIDREEVKREIEALEGRAREASAHVHTGDFDMAVDELNMLIDDAKNIRNRLADVAAALAAIEARS